MNHIDMVSLAVDRTEDRRRTQNVTTFQGTFRVLERSGAQLRRSDSRGTEGSGNPIGAGRRIHYPRTRFELEFHESH